MVVTIDDDLDVETNRGDVSRLDGTPSIGQIHSIPMVKAKSEVVGANPINEASHYNETPAVDLKDKMEL